MDLEDVPLSPGPHEAPDLWNSITIGPLPPFPAIRGEGAVKVKVKTGAELDQQKANGKTVPRTKVKGKKVAKVSLLFSFTRVIYDPSNLLRIAIDPGGENYGRAWEVEYPECADRGVNRLIFTEMGELVSTGDIYSFSVDAEGWNEPAKAQAGGTTTPKTAAPASSGKDYYQASNSSSAGGSGSSSATAGAGVATGFNGPSAPKADP